MSVHTGDSVEFHCNSRHFYNKMSITPHPTWIFSNVLPIDGIAERNGIDSIFIKSANLTHIGQYTCVGLKRSKLKWISFIATGNLIVLGKILIVKTFSINVIITISSLTILEM